LSHPQKEKKLETQMNISFRRSLHVFSSSFCFCY
jgi:hypothetical protein